MNSGWRYQYIAKDCAVRSRRFITVSDIGASEADFNATMNIVDSKKALNIYVSIKNRANTMGGQDWPKAISALESVARSDKNRSGPYICVFGIAIDKGQIRRIGKTKALNRSTPRCGLREHIKNLTNPPCIERIGRIQKI
jgi:hypothetical protein